MIGMDRDEATTQRPTAVVTGATRGIGARIVTALRAAGFDVVAVARGDAPTVGGAADESLGRCIPVRADVTAPDAAEHVVQAALAHTGRIDTLVNAAGLLTRPPRDLLDVDAELLDASWAVNARGAFLFSRAVARHWLATPADAHPRSIVNIGSIAAEVLEPRLGPYGMTKSALAVCTQLFALRLADVGIGVHEVRPGFIAREGTVDPRASWIADGGVPMRRQGTADEVAEVVVTLARGGLPYVTGQAIWVAGGMNIPRAR